MIKKLLLLFLVLAACASPNKQESSWEMTQEEYNENILEESELYENKILVSPYNSYGTLVYKIDSIFTIDVTSRVEARIIKSVDEESVDKLVSLTHKSSTGKIEKVIINVDDIMDMDLISLDKEAFIINKLNNRQSFNQDNIAYWVWGVTPIKIGKFDLFLRATIKENNIDKNIIVFDKVVSVNNKPKKKYQYNFIIPSELKSFEKNIVKLNIRENSYNYNFEWEGNGEIILEFDNIINVEPKDNYYIDYNKNIFNYSWEIEPLKSKDLNYTIKIIGDYEEVILEEGTVKVTKNFEKSFNRFIDETLNKWYYIFTTLLIPLYIQIKKKFFKKELDEEEKK